VLQKTVSILAAAALVAGAVLWSGAGGARGGAAPQAQAAARPRPRPGHKWMKFGPYSTYEEALKKKRYLERKKGWEAYIKEWDDEFWVYARKRPH
jgi:hypothetical protein